jgi:predicted O-methyltransferase YrrM
MRPGARIAEFGTGYGVGTAWLLSGMDNTSRLITVELDPARAAINRATLTDPRVTALEEDWTVILQHGMFDLIFSDATAAKQETDGLTIMLELLRPGGCIVMDNFSPLGSLPAHLNGVDPIREAIWARTDLIPLEVGVSETERVILAVKRA